MHRVVVCDPRKNALLQHGSKSDKVDVRKLADLLRTNMLSPVYHGHTGVGALREMARRYLALTQDTTRVMNRIKAVLSAELRDQKPAVVNERCQQVHSSTVP